MAPPLTERQITDVFGVIQVLRRETNANRLSEWQRFFGLLHESYHQQLPATKNLLQLGPRELESRLFLVCRDYNAIWRAFWIVREWKNIVVADPYRRFLCSGLGLKSSEGQEKLQKLKEFSQGINFMDTTLSAPLEPHVSKLRNFIRRYDSHYETVESPAILEADAVATLMHAVHRTWFEQGVIVKVASRINRSQTVDPIKDDKDIDFPEFIRTVDDLREFHLEEHHDYGEDESFYKKVKDLLSSLNVRPRPQEMKEAGYFREFISRFDHEGIGHPPTLFPGSLTDPLQQPQVETVATRHPHMQRIQRINMSYEFHVFLSHNSQDKPAVRELAAALRKRDLHVWLDEDELRPGIPWQRKLADGIRASASIAVLIGKDGLGPWEDEEMQAALRLAVKDERPVIPVVLPDAAQPPELPIFLSNRTWVDLRPALSEAGLKKLEWDITGVNPNQSHESAGDGLQTVNAPVSISEEIGRPACRLLHLSDLHCSSPEQVTTWLVQLSQDLRIGLGCEKLDGIVVSGDLVYGPAPAPLTDRFAAAATFLKGVMEQFQVGPQQVIIVPGNHDLDWGVSKKAYRLKYRDEAEPLVPGRFYDEGERAVSIRDDAVYPNRFDEFRNFYQQICNEDFPAKLEGQFVIRHFDAQRLLFLGLNSACETDHHFASRASIDMRALSTALMAINRQKEWSDYLKIAVWHHPLSGEDEGCIRDLGFLELLAQAGFRLVLHGHIHKADTALYRYDRAATRGGRQIEIVAAGTFGAPSREWFAGYPAQYNLLEFARGVLTVHTRRREEDNGAWKPDARWQRGAGKDPLPRYEVRLSPDSD